MSAPWIGSFARKNGGFTLLAKISGYERVELSDFSRGFAIMTAQQIADIRQAMRVINPDSHENMQQSKPKANVESDDFPIDDSAMFFAGCGGFPLLCRRA